MMHWHRSLWLVLLYFPMVCPSTQRHTQRTQRTHSKIKFCDAAFSNQRAGALTKKCSSGFYREQIGLNRGQCVPCSCNGLSTECDEHTGNCVNCQFNTTGARCERCKEGYYGNAAKRTCHACPCPFTWSNFALACLDIGSGEVECLCKRGYSGAKCERCAHGYYGNPMVPGGSCKPCNLGNSILNNCDSLNRGCATCSYSLLVDLEKMDNDLTLLQLQNISIDYVSHIRLNNLEANVSQTKVLGVSYSTAAKHLGPKVEELETDVNVIRDDLNQLTNMVPITLQTGSDLSTVLQNVNRTVLKTDDLLSGTESLVTAIPDLILQLSEVKPGGSITLSDNDKVGMMEEAQHIVQEMRERGCTAQRVSAGSQQEDANKLLTLINNSMTVPMETIPAILSQTSDSLMVSDSNLRELAALLLEADGRVDRTQDLNLKSHTTTLQHLQHLQTQMEKGQSMLLPVTEMTKDLLKNISNIFLMLEEIKNELYKDESPLDGAKRELFKKLDNTFHMRPKVDIVTNAEKHAEQLYRAAAGFHQVLHTTNSTELLSVPHRGSYNRIINVIGETEMAANQSREAAGQALKEVKSGLVNRAEELKDNSSLLQQEARKTQSYLKMLSHTVNSHSDRVKKQKDKRESLRTGVSAVTDDLKMIRRDNTNVLIESAKTAASASNSTIRNITDRLRSISQEVERITVANVSVNMDHKLTDAEQTVRNLSVALPTLTNSLAQVEALSKKVAQGANMTDSIRRVKDVIEETRTMVNRLSIATTFNGKGHVELRPPRNLKDIKAFTAIDLLLNQHQKDPSKADSRRRRRQGKHRDGNFFVFYLGNKDASGDYIGMALRNGVLICIYKLGGVVHEVETKSQITTTTSVNSTDLDRVVFHRVYQDAEVNITHKYTSLRPVALSPNHNLPNTIAGVLDLDTDSVVVYVGGHPDEFKPPLELRYPKYRGAMKLSYINDNPVSLFNYKHAVNMDTLQPHIKIPQSEVSDYYDGTGYRMAFIKAPDKKTRRLFRFHTSSRETDALLFYIGNEEDFFCVYVEGGFLVLQGQQAGRELRAQTAERVSLFDKTFAITTAEQLIVQYGPHKISTDHVPTHYRRYYIGGLPEQLRRRHNITAPPLRGCVDHLTADGEIVEYNRTMGVTDGCPLPLLGVCAATLSSALSIDSLFVGGEQPLRVSLGFRTTGTHGTLVRSSSQDLQLSLADGFVVFTCNNYTLKSDKRYSDGSWHYLSAVRRPAGLELSIDNINVTDGESHHHKPEHQNSTGEKFKACISNLYTRRPEQSFTPADLSSFLQMRDTVLGMCNLHSPPQEHEPVQVPAGSQCRNRGVHRGEYQLYDDHSWLSHTLPQEDLNYRPHFSLDVKTTSSKGLILHVAGTGVVPLMALYMANGKIRMALGQNRIIQHNQKSNDGNWHRVEISVEKSTFHLLVDGVRVPDGHLPNDEGSSLDLHSPVYLGADPKNTKGRYIPINSVTGCIRDFRMNDVAVEEPEATHRILPCPDGLTEMGTYFGGGHIVKDNYFAVGSNFVLSFELRPQYLTGLLFHAESDQASLDVFLMENKVGVKVYGVSGAVSVSVTPHESLCDGQFHMVTVSKLGEVIKLEADSMSEQKALPFMSHSTALDSVYIGGTTKYNQAPVSSPFVGCLRNVRVNERPVAFDTHATVAGPVRVNGCPKL